MVLPLHLVDLFVGVNIELQGVHGVERDQNSAHASDHVPVNHFRLVWDILPGRYEGEGHTQHDQVDHPAHYVLLNVKLIA